MLLWMILNEFVTFGKKFSPQPRGPGSRIMLPESRESVGQVLARDLERGPTHGIQETTPITISGAVFGIV
jgi:hypothetical protein